MSSTHRFRRTTALAGLLALVLWLGASAAGPSAHADGPAAVFYGYVVPEAGGALPLRVRALSDSGVVCGSGDVVATATPAAGFYAMVVVPESAKEGCPAAADPVHFVFVHGLIDENVPVAQTAVYLPGEAIPLTLGR